MIRRSRCTSLRVCRPCLPANCASRSAMGLADSGDAGVIAEALDIVEDQHGAAFGTAAFPTGEHDDLLDCLASIVAALCHHASSSSNAFASFSTGMSRPSVNQP